MKKGDMATIKSCVYSGYPEPYDPIIAEMLGEKQHLPTIAHEPPDRGDTKKRCLFRQSLQEPTRVLIVGRSTRKTGYYYPASGDINVYSCDYDSYEPAYLSVDKTHIVYMVQLLYRQNWMRPLACMADDFVEVE